MSAAARSKAQLSRQAPPQYLVLSALAGAFVGLGIVLIFAIGAPLQAAGSAAVKTVMGASFGIALTLVIFAGSELFTGNNLVMTVGALTGSTTPGAVARVWAASFVGNLLGSMLLAAAVAASGVLAKAPAREFVVAAAAMKMAAPLGELFFRALLCNALVCLAVWMSLRAKDEVAKLVLIFWCLFAFIGSGYEHSVANMTLLSVALLVPHDPAAVSWLGFARNLSVVTLGNVVGGALCIALPYWYVAQGQRRAQALRPVQGDPVAGPAPEAATP